MARTKHHILALAVVTALTAAPAFAAQPTAPVAISGGQISGTSDTGISTYLGIPFAAPPTGKRRWQPPQPVISWSGIKPARNYASACEQTATWITNPKSEDCLYLNVWAPSHARKRPVIVWIHGGAMESGTAAVPVQNGARLARRGAIFVTLNYRLGIFGFYASPELSRESPHHISGNQGIRDQIAALRWVKANIAAFGGDPGRVTIMGNSSGAESVALLVASPLARGLFQRAIAESGNDALPIDPADDARFNDKPTAEAKGLAFATAAGAGDLAGLRQLSAEALLKQPWEPRAYVDGDLLRADMTTTYRTHAQNDVPLLTGWTAEEGKDLAAFYLDPAQTNAAGRVAQMTALLGHAPSAEIQAAYPGATDTQAAASLNQLVNDWWGWRMVHWAGLQARYGRSKAYVYYFAHRPAAPATPCGWGCGAGHGVEVQYMLDNLDVDPRAWSSDDRALADRLADTVIRFARTGKPGWPVFTGAAATIVPIGNATELQAHHLPDFSLFDADAQ